MASSVVMIVSYVCLQCNMKLAPPHLELKSTHSFSLIYDASERPLSAWGANHHPFTPDNISTDAQVCENQNCNLVELASSIYERMTASF